MPNSSRIKCQYCAYNTFPFSCEGNGYGSCNGIDNYRPLKLKIYKTIAVDFDGTLCEFAFPEIGEPKPYVIEFLKMQQAAGAHIILSTCRANGTKRALLDEAVQFCKEQGIDLYAINENPDNTYGKEYGVTGTERKVFADLYIDDKAMNTSHLEMSMFAYLNAREAGEAVEQDI